MFLQLARDNYPELLVFLGEPDLQGHPITQLASQELFQPRGLVIYRTLSHTEFVSGPT